MTCAIAEQATLWLLRLQESPHDSSLLQQFGSWRASDPRHAAEFDAIRALWDGFDSVESSRRLAQSFDALQATRRRRLLAGSVAGLMLLATLPSAWRHWQDMPQHRIALVSGTAQTQAHALPDGSTIVLGADSAVDVVYTRRERRAVMVRGEAAFDVMRGTSADSVRSFDVVSGHARVSVLGTRFVVTQLDDRASVTVLEGRVRVASDGIASALELDAGESADIVADRAPQRVERSAAEATDFIDGRIVFRQAGLDEVARTLSRYRDAPVRASASHAGPRIDAVIQHGRIDEFLAMLPLIAKVDVSEHANATVLTPR